MSQKLSILYVEDDQDIQDITALTLEGDCILNAFSSGLQAIECADKLAPDLLLLDVMMPEIDGPQTLQKLREFPHLSNTPVIFMTAKVQPSEVDSYMAMGAKGVIVKPFDPLTLLQEINKLLS